MLRKPLKQGILFFEVRVSGAEFIRHSGDVESCSERLAIGLPAHLKTITGRILNFLHMNNKHQPQCNSMFQYSIHG